MLNLIANDTKKQLKSSFTDVKLKELSKAYEILATQSINVLGWLNNDKECPEQEMYDFKILWVSLFSNFTTDELKLIPLVATDSLSLDFLFTQCKFLMYQPKSALDIKEFKIGGKTYKLIESLKTIGGAEMLFGNANYRQWMLSSQLAKIIEENKNEKCIQGLIQLMAVLYTDGDDSDKGLEKRIEAFQEVDALTGWSCYFFFALLLDKYKDFFQSYTNNLKQPLAKKKYLLEKLKRKLSQTRIGKLLPSRLLNTEFLVLEN